MNTEHTPTPWCVAERSEDQGIGLEIWCNNTRTTYPHDICIAEIVRDAPPKEQEANAAFIVRAVNAHEALVSSIKALLATPLGRNLSGEKVDAVNQALALAEGGGK